MAEGPYGRLLDDEDLNRELLGRALDPYIRIGKKSGDIILRDEYDELSKKNKVAVYLLALKVLHDLGKDSETTTPNQISDFTGVKGNTVRSILKRFRHDDLVKKRGGNSYEIPNYRVEKVIDELE